MDLNPDILKVEKLTKYFGGLAASWDLYIKVLLLDWAIKV